jgi:hypothetical protein
MFCTTSGNGPPVGGKVPDDRKDDTHERLRGFLDRVSDKAEMEELRTVIDLLKHMDKVPPGHHPEVLGILESFHSLPQKTQDRLLPALEEVIGTDEEEEP